jgi:tetratricopeptide (TPR) repeat protein
VLDVVGRRLVRLSPTANEVLAVAAVCGLDFSARVVSGVADAGEPERVLDALDEAVRARLLVETGPGRFAFGHAIVRETLLRELTSVHRARLHRSVGGSILAVYGDSTDLPLSELALHFTEAAILGDAAAAGQWAIAAALAAAAQADQRGAAATLARALMVIEAVEPLDQTARFEVAAALLERQYLLWEQDDAAVASALAAAGHLRSAAAMLRLGIARGFGTFGVSDPLTLELFAAAIEVSDNAEAPLRAVAMAGSLMQRAWQGDASFIKDVDVVLELIASVAGDAPRTAAVGTAFVMTATAGLPGAADRLRLLDDALAVAPDAPDEWWSRIASAVDLQIFTTLWRGHALLAIGRRADFEGVIEAARRDGEATGNAIGRATPYTWGAVLARADGRFDEVPDLCQAMVDAAPGSPSFQISYFGSMAQLAFDQGGAAAGLPMLTAIAALTPDLPSVIAFNAVALVETGERDKAIAVVENVIERWDTWIRDMTWPGALAGMARAIDGLRAHEHATLVLAELDRYAGELAVGGLAVMCFGAFDRYRGMLLGVLGRHDEAIVALEAAVDLEANFPAPAYVAQSQHELSRALLHRGGPGDNERGRAVAAEALDAAERFGMVGLIANVKSLVAELTP